VERAAGGFSESCPHDQWALSFTVGRTSVNRTLFEPEPFAMEGDEIE
jgi:hypothetical protein